MLKNNIHVINLEKNKDRLKHVTYNFNKYDLKFIRFDATYGKDMLESEIKTNTTRSCRTILCSRSVIGCAMSHIQLWKKLLDDNYKQYYVILEDDAEIDNEFVEILDKIDELIFNNEIEFDVIHFYTEYALPKPTYDPIILNDKYKLRRTLFSLSAKAYILSKSGAQKLYDKIHSNIEYHIDVQMSGMITDGLIMYHISPDLVRDNEQDGLLNSTNINIPNTITISLLKLLNFNKLVWTLSTNAFCIKTKYQLNLFFCIIVILFIINETIIKNLYFRIFLITEILLYVYSFAS